MQTDVDFMAPAQSEQIQQIKIEVLEYGKYCETLNGAIVDHAAEHLLLGATYGFPELLRPWCQPENLGISKGQLEEEAQRLFEKVSWGTALRPVLVEGKILQVLYRVGVRSEGGNVLTRRRKYSLARYLVDPSRTASPLTLFKAMSPLVGLTREMAAALEPIRVSLPSSSLEEATPEPFLQQALTYIISGIPVHLKLPETEFFRLVEQVWQALPAEVRPFLSAGWNISSSMASEFGIFSAAAPVEQTAMYSATGGWSRTQSIRRSLVFGQLYSAVYFQAVGSETQSLIEKYLNAPGPPVRTSRTALSSIPGFRDPGILSRFEDAGISVLEIGALERLRDWMISGNSAIANQLEHLVSRVLSRSEVKNLIKMGFGVPAFRQRTDQLAWVFLTKKNQLYADGEMPNEDGARRGLLLQAVARGEAHLTLKSLLAAVLVREADDLPAEVIKQIPVLLSSTLDEVQTHWELLRAPAAVNVYDEWARENALELALQFAADANLAQPAVEKLQELYGQKDAAPPSLAVITKLTSGQRSTKEDQAIVRRMASQQTERFCSVLETVWKQADARNIDRAMLLDWCAGLPHQYNDPALTLASGATITPVQINILARQCGALPQSLLYKLSEAALYASRNSRDILQYVRHDHACWNPIVSLWPQEVALALLGEEFHDPQRSVQHSERKFAKDFYPSADLIQNTIEDWLLGLRPIKLLLEAAPVIWNWIKALPGPGPENNTLMAVDICWCLANRKLIRDTKINSSPYDEVHLVTTLVRFSGQYEQLTRDATVLWKSAAHGWQLKLLLELFPAVEFSPLAAQLSALVPYRRWLQIHLERGDIAAGRNAAFKIATADLQTIQYPGREDQKWREEWDGSVLRAAGRISRVSSRAPAAIRCFSSLCFQSR